MRKFKRGVSCIIDKNTEYEEEGVLVKVPYKNQYKEWMVEVVVISEDMGTDEQYHHKKYIMRILKERVTLK